jgi:hypothetical protein
LALAGPMTAAMSLLSISDGVMPAPALAWALAKR